MPLPGARCAGAGATATSGGQPHRLSDEAPQSDGTTHHLFTGLELLRRLASLVSPPRANLTRFHGVFAYSASDVPDRGGGCNSNGAKRTGPACLAFGWTGLTGRTHVHGYWAPAFPGAQDRR
ncbi:transposase [Myxococcus sp. AB056]|uniref:transposase n=1 Tax=Myxococcus sp. AB056 TaxID=2562792 RepID=UPI001E43D4A6